jgi:hypothetical protein
LHEREGGAVNRVGPQAEPAPAPPPPAPAAARAVTGDRRYAAGAASSPKKAVSKPRASAQEADEESEDAQDLSGTTFASGVSAESGRAVSVESQGGLSAPRRISALAAVAVDSGATRYRLPVRVTVPDASATMVLLINQRVAGEAVFLFAPDPGVPDSIAHPFRVARFTNQTPGLLERGPIAVFEKGAFLGQGMLEPLPPKATATVPFALERSLAFEGGHQFLELGARLFKIDALEMIVERDTVSRTLYKIKNGSEQNAKVLVRHKRVGAGRLYKPPAGTEDNLGSGYALVPIAVQAAARAELTVEERWPSQQRTDWMSPIADEAIKAYLADPRADRALVAALSHAWAQREALKKAGEERAALTQSQAELERSARETRLSLQAIEKNKQAGDLRAKLTARLGEVTGRLDQITKKLVEVDMRAAELQVRFRDAVRDIRFSTPLPPKD